MKQGIKNLTKIILIALLFATPTSCCEIHILYENDDYTVLIDNVTNVGVCDMNLTFDTSVVNITDVADGDFDVTIPVFRRVREGCVRIGAHQTDSPSGLDGTVTFAKIELWIGERESGMINISVNEITDRTNNTNPIPYTVRNFTTARYIPPGDTQDGDDNNGGGSSSGGGGMIHTPTPVPTPAPTPAAPSAAATPAEEGMPANTTAPTPEKVTAFRTEPLSLPPSVLSPIAGIVIVVIAAILGVIRVIGITAQTRDETYAEAITSIKQAECRRAIVAIIGIVVVAIAAITGILLI